MNEQQPIVTAVIPAHLASVRFPRKILYDFHGLPMIEHVRRRALISTKLDRVIVATCDDEIARAIIGFGGEVIMTENTHRNGTTRVAEAIKKVDCTHVIILQGDEPLLLPRHIDNVVNEIQLDQKNLAWNVTGPIENIDELDRHSFVKCAVSPSNQIMYCFRRSPSYSSYENQSKYIRKILGIIAYRKDFLTTLEKIKSSPIEQLEFIEQMRIIENGYLLKSIPVQPSLPSINEPHEADIVHKYIEESEEQQHFLSLTLKMKLD